jgi:rRNA maturation RNase YbeY
VHEASSLSTSQGRKKTTNRSKDSPNAEFYCFQAQSNGLTSSVGNMTTKINHTSLNTSNNTLLILIYQKITIQYLTKIARTERFLFHVEHFWPNIRESSTIFAHHMATIALTFEDNLHQSKIEEQKVWLEKVLLKLNLENHSLSYVFIPESDMVELNNQVLGHNYATDIITFDLNGELESYTIHAELVISQSVVEQNAKTYKTTFEEEMRRVMIHGVLHLIGFDDKSEESRVEMRKKENELIKIP